MKIITTLAATAAMALLPTASAMAGDHTCDNFTHGGYAITDLTTHDIGCSYAKKYAKHVIAHGVGDFIDKGWACFESTGLGGHGSAGCHKGHHRFSLSWQPFHF